MRELAEYHNLTSLWHNDIKEDTNIFDVIEKSDFKSPEKVQESNFDNFISFLDKNNIVHVYEKDINLTRVPFDKKILDINLRPPLKPLTGCTTEQIVNRFENYHTVKEDKRKKQEEKYRAEIKILKKQIKKQKEHVKKYKNDKLNQERKIKHLEGTLNRKSARFALKVANMFSRK